MFDSRRCKLEIVKHREQRLYELAAALVEGMSVKDAMSSVGYAPSTAENEQIWHTDENSVKRRISPRNHPVVQKYLKEIQDEAVRTLPEKQSELKRKAVIEIHDIVEKLERAFHKAEYHNKPSAMVSAALGQAKVLGLLDNSKVMIKPLEQWTDEELKALLGKSDAVH